MDIDIRNVSVSFPLAHGSIQALRHVELHLTQGAITAVVGESGSGKSILGSAIMGLLGDQAELSGEILCDGKNLLAMTEKEKNRFRGSRIGWIAQDPVSAMDPVMKVGRQMAEGLSKRNRTEQKKIIIDQLRTYALDHPEEIYHRYPRELSGGMAQRTLIAMMTLPSPQWLIADEPTKGLDAFVRKEVCQVLRGLRDKKGMGILLITHDLSLAARLSDYTAVIYAGEIIEYGKTGNLFQHPRHPYTQGLIAACPRNGLKPICGTAPNLSALPQGCAFAPRCRFCTKKCHAKQSLLSGPEGCQIRCWKGGAP